MAEREGEVMDVSELSADKLLIELAFVKKEKKDIYAREKQLENEIERRLKNAIEERRK